ncbi:hypothetical protein [Dictyobacter formicarum]|uniref:Secreted protein n=1 Tax=Dictyobacter formicarum TaxID=2778368 RepID=A0ABQ3VEX8_9CHLR|nr:hypothetical protein [Dictyobacter formicarum]GHO84373.1 hypothetical protein KSZ_23790 [Dictyobacter formicarum]
MGIIFLTMMLVSPFFSILNQAVPICSVHRTPFRGQIQDIYVPRQNVHMERVQVHHFHGPVQQKAKHHSILLLFAEENNV